MTIDLALTWRIYIPVEETDKKYTNKLMCNHYANCKEYEVSKKRVTRKLNIIQEDHA